MKYIRGDQDYRLEDKPLTKISLIEDDDPGGEGIWVKQADDHVVLQNHALAFYPFPSWGTVLPSNGGAGDRRETVNASRIKDGPLELTLHPEAWDTMLERGDIDADGMFIPPQEEPDEAPTAEELH